MIFGIRANTKQCEYQIACLLCRCDTLGSFGGVPIYSNDVDDDLLKFADRLFVSKCEVSVAFNLLFVRSLVLHEDFHI